jgi:hypothetical protein
VLIALLGTLAANGVFRGNTKGLAKENPKEGVIVLQNLPPDAEVMLDGEKVKAKPTGDEKLIEIQVAPDKEHKLEIKRAGFKTAAQDVTLASGERKPIDIHLEPLASASEKPASPPAKVTAPPKTVIKKEPVVVSTWQYTNPSNVTFPITLYSNGHFMTPDGVPTWDLRGNVLTLRWGGASPRSPVDTCILSPDGKSFQGQNQGRFKMSGKKVSD